MEIICECGHGIEEHGLLGCIDPKVARWNDCNCKLPKEAVEARYWARVMLARYIGGVMWCEMLKIEHDGLVENNRVFQHRGDNLQTEVDRLKAVLYDEGVELRKTRNHYIQACVQRDEIKHKLYKLEDSLSEKDDEDIDEIREQLRMCQLALQTMERAHAELESYTRIAVNTLNKIEPNNPGPVNFLIAQDALDKIKGKF